MRVDIISIFPDYFAPLDLSLIGKARGSGLLDLTVGEYFLPSGENIGKKGVRPTVKAVDNPKTNKDEALPVALRSLAGKVTGQ